MYGGDYRFKADFRIATELTSDNNTYISKTGNNRTFMAYIQGGDFNPNSPAYPGADKLRINLSGAQGTLKGIAMDTRGSDYNIRDLGTISKTNQTIDLPYKSEWVIYITRRRWW